MLLLQGSSGIITCEGEGVLNYLKAPNFMKQNLNKLKILKMYKNPEAELILLKLLLAHSPSPDKIMIEEKCHIDAIEGFGIARESIITKCKHNMEPM